MSESASELAESEPSVPAQSGYASLVPVQPVITYILIALNVAVFIGMMLTGANIMHPTTRQAVSWGADFGPLTLDGQWWRVISACFVHFGLIHIAMNMVILWQVGVFTEKLFGNVRYLLLYLLAGVYGNLLSIAHHPQQVSAGASGAVFGVYGGLLGFLVVQRGVVPRANAMSIAKSAGIFIVYNLIYGLSSPEIDLDAHIGGLISGFLAGCLLARPIWATGQRIYPVRTMAVLIGGAALAYAWLHGLGGNTSQGQNEWMKQLMVGKSVTVGSNDRIIYSGVATKADANNLAQALVKSQYFQHPDATVLLSKTSGEPVVSLPTGHAKAQSTASEAGPTQSSGKSGLAPWDDRHYLAQVEALGVEIAPSVGGPPMKIAILSEDGEPQRTVEIIYRDAAIGDSDDVWYSGSATESEARALGAALQQEKYFRGKGGLVCLDKNADGTSISYLVKEGTWNSASMVQSFSNISRRVAGSVGGLPVRTRLLDRNREEKKRQTTD